MRANADIGPRAGHCIPGTTYEVDNGRFQHARFVRQVVFDQNAVVLMIARIDEAIIDVRQRNTGNVDTGVAQDPVLNRAIEHMVILDRRRCLYLCDTPATRIGQEYIDTHEHTLEPERRLEDREVRAAVQQFPRPGNQEPNALVELDFDRVRRAVDSSRDLADPVTRLPE
jgi:hypothetical protein